MVIGGALFGIFAGITYWFPKTFGFTLHERLGKYAFWCWLIGFFTAFVPLYILGLMGATRRLDHYDTTAWQPLFLIALLGSLIIMLAVFLQVLQIIVSIRKRNHLRDKTGDHWNGRTLEWATSSPPPFYNFAVIPEVNSRDAFWEMKASGAHGGKPHYESFTMPKNTAAGIYISAFIFLLGFGFVWHITWLIVLGLLGTIVCFILRAYDDETEYVVTSEEVAEIESRIRNHESRKNHNS
jgi:cytochrome o ubiquinol oxidase subunit 1